MTYLKLTCLFPCLLLALEFTHAPVLTPEGPDSWQVEFGVDESTDVEVSIVSLRDSSVVRHLAAGVLGANPPAPLAANTLQQALAWDGKGDLGETITLPAESLTVRVRAGMHVSWNTCAENDPYTFFLPGTGGNWCFNGLEAKPDGSVYAYGSATNTGVMTVRCYDAEGVYRRTVFPYPSTLPSTDVTGLGVNLWDDGSFSPKTDNNKSVCRLSPLMIAGVPKFSSTEGSAGSTLMPSRNPGTLFFMGTQGSCMTVSVDGSRQGTAVHFPLITSPVLPVPSGSCCPPEGTPLRAGTQFVCEAADGAHYYMSGVWSYAGSTAVDTGFWKDGQVFKVDKNTGITSAFIRLDSVPTALAVRSARIGPSGGSADTWTKYSSIHGMTTDDSGHIFICDRLHSQIGVYDTTGLFLGSIKVRHPEMVHVSKNTGAVYVLTRDVTGWYTGTMNLLKYNGWRGSPAAACSAYVGSEVHYYGAWAYLAVSEAAGGTPHVWVAHIYMPDIKIYRDNGSSFSFLKNLRGQSRNFLGGFDRLAVDRRTETVYLQDGWTTIGKVEEWSNPVAVPCSTTGGQRIRGHDMTVTFDGQLYVQGPGECGDSIKRYTSGRYHAPVDYPNTNYNALTPGNWSHMGANMGFPGFAVSAGKITAVSLPVDWSNGFYSVIGMADSGQSTFNIYGCDRAPTQYDTLAGRNLGIVGGIRFDLQDNLYVGFPLRSKAHVVPAGFASDPAYLSGVGAVFKFAKGSHGRVDGDKFCFSGCPSDAEDRATDCERIYTAGYAPFSMNEHCFCRTPRFDVDLFGRLFIPNAITQQVSVMDNNGNEIVAFGRYGNYDSKGPGSAIPDPAIPFAWPTGAAASDDFIYVTDFGNSRLARIAMNYALENIRLPIASATAPLSVRGRPLELVAAPNPFNPAVSFTVKGWVAGETSLRLFTVAGKLAADLTPDVRNGHVKWTAQEAAAGIYLAIASKNGQRAVRRVVYAR